MPNAKYTISIPSTDKELIDFVNDKKKHSNFSLYIRDLVKKDMDNPINNDLENIYEYVLSRLKDDDSFKSDKNLDEVDQSVDDIDKDIIMDLF